MQRKQSDQVTNESEMYQVLVVDDEKLIREGIGESLQVIGPFDIHYASNGLEAIMKCQSFQFDAILIDIIMPKMNGVELIKALDEMNCEAILIVISAHGEFEFAREALSHRVVQYLLKPVYPDDIEKLSGFLERTIEDRNRKTEHYNQLIKQLEESHSLMRSRLIEDLLFDRISYEEFLRHKFLIELDTQNIKFRVMLIRVEPIHYDLVCGRELQLKILTAEEILNVIISHYSDCELFRINPHVFAFLFYTDSIEKIDDVIDNFFADVSQEMQRQELMLFGGIGDPVDCINQINKSYQEALMALKFNAYSFRESALSIRDIQKDQNICIIPFNEESFISNVKLADKQAIKTFFNGLKSFIKQNTTNLSYEHTEIVLMRIVLVLKEVLYEFKPKNYHRIELACDQITNKMKVSIDYEEAIDRVMTNTFQVVREIEQNRDESNVRVIERIKKYIHIHYMEDLSLTKLADTVFMSKNYLGQLFKQKTNVSIIDYIHQTRMNHAKELIERTDLKLYEIAYKVGYSDQHYFSLVFKKFVGVSPSEYRELC